MTNQPKISVIMPSLNVVQYIEECILSVMNQTMHEIEIICVDAGSTDGTLEVLREYQGKDERIRLIESPIKSYGYQMNLGMDAARGEYIGIVETDDWIRKEMYASLYQYAKKYELDFIKSDFYRFECEGGKLLTTYNGLSKKSKYYKKVIKPSEEIVTFTFIMNTWCGIYRTEFLRENQIRYNETSGASYQDNGFWFQTHALAKRTFFLDKAFYMNRRDNPNSSVYSREKVYCINEEFEFIRNFLSHYNKLENQLLPVFYLKKFENYLVTYYRIDDRFKEEYIQNFSKEFKEHQIDGMLDADLFGKKNWEVLQEIIGNPQSFYDASMKQIEGKCKNDNGLMKGLILCYEEHGMKYTISRIIHRIKR